MKMAHSLEDAPAPLRRRINHLEEDPPVPVLGGLPDEDSVCIDCFCEPCVVDPAVLPAFVRGSAAPDLSNVAKRYRLYRKFWSHL